MTTKDSHFGFHLCCNAGKVHNTERNSDSFQSFSPAHARYESSLRLLRNDGTPFFHSCTF